MFSGILDSASTRRRPSARWLSGTALAVIGIALITRSQPVEHTKIVGIVAAFGAGLAWAVYAKIVQLRIAHHLDPTTCMAALFSGGAALSTPILAFGDTRWIASGRGAVLSVYLGVATVGVVYTCLGWGLRLLPAPNVVTLVLIEPVTAAVLAAVVLHQSVGIIGWLGVLVVITALAITAADTEAVRPKLTT